jgi:hypothetical protein
VAKLKAKEFSAPEGANGRGARESRPAS